MNIADLKSNRIRSIILSVVLVILLILFLTSGIREQTTVENLRALGANRWTAFLIIMAMTGAWAFALPASVFFFITPLLFSPLPATAIICVGSATGTTMGYIAARYIGGSWVERFRDHRVTRFLKRHSSFASLFAIRAFPSSPHGFINYGAGLVRIPLPKFLLATLCGVGIKAFLYATAISGSVGASSIREALNWQTVTALTAISLLAIGGHVVQRRWEERDRASAPS
ncbi:MAG: VTT domain-containing protein [Bacteroidota bacterium]